MRRFLRRFLIVAVLGYAALCCIAAVFLAEITLHPGRRTLASADEAQAREMSDRHDAQIENATISANDGASLRAWLIRPHSGNGDAVILLHGLSDNRIGMIGYAELLVNHGFTVLLPDARAHGASGGPLRPMAFWNLTTYAAGTSGSTSHQHPACIFGFGESMGAAQLLACPAKRAELLRGGCGITVFHLSRDCLRSRWPVLPYGPLAWTYSSLSCRRSRFRLRAMA